MYDLKGSKIELFVPDDGAFPTVNVLCQLPVFSTVLTVWVSHIESIDSLYLQLSRNSNIISKLLEELFQFYENGGVIVETFTKQSLCCVKSIDGNWYRARIVEVLEDEVKVLYIDYGNGETLPKSNIKKFDDKFNVPYELALNVSLGLIQNSEDLREKFLELTRDKELKASVIYGENGWIVDLFDGELNVNKQLVDLNLASYADAPIIMDNNSVITMDNNNQLLLQSIPEEKRASITITHTDSPSEFYIQLIANEEEIFQLQSDLQEIIDKQPDLEGADIGSLCAAKYSLDEQWYRAEVLDADTDITTVRFIDYGNTDVIDNNSNGIKTLPSDLLAIGRYARKCSLNIVPIKDEWDPEACELFINNTSIVEGLYVDIVYQDDKKTYVELYDSNDISIAQSLIDCKFAERITRDAEDHLANNTGFVSHLNSILEFWIQLESSVPDLEMIVDRLSEVDTFPDLQDLSPGILCAANFPEDEMWYRARILSNTVAGIEVLYIDYGNSSTALRLKVLPEDLAHMPALAMKCCLHKPPNVITQWTESATAKFQEISEEGATIFTVNKLSTGETATVELFVNGSNIIDQIIPFCGNDHPEDDLLSTGNNSSKCVIDYITSLSEFSVLELSSGKEGVMCFLERPEGVIEWDEGEEVAFKNFNDAEVIEYDVEYVTMDEPRKVRLTYNGKNVTELIKVVIDGESVKKSERININKVTDSEEEVSEDLIEPETAETSMDDDKTDVKETLSYDDDGDNLQDDNNSIEKDYEDAKVTVSLSNNF